MPKTIDIKIGGRTFTVRGPNAGMLRDLEEVRLDAVEAEIAAERAWRGANGEPPPDETPKQRAARLQTTKEGRDSAWRWYLSVVSASITRSGEPMTPEDVEEIEGGTPDEIAVAAAEILIHVGLMKPKGAGDQGEADAQPLATMLG